MACQECYGTYPNCPVCNETPNLPVYSSEMVNLGTTKFSQVKDAVGFRINLFQGKIEITTEWEYRTWRDQFVRKYGKATLGIETATYPNGYTEKRFYVFSEKYIQKKKDFFTRLSQQNKNINKFLGL